MIQFSDGYPHGILQHTNPSLFSWEDQLSDSPAIAVFGSPSSLDIGDPHIYYQVRD